MYVMDTLAERFKQAGRTAVSQGAARVQIGEQHEFAWVQDLGRFGHEQHAGKHDNVRFSGGRLPGKLQAIAHKIGQILNLRFLVVMREDHRIHLGLQALDLAFQVEMREGGQIFSLRGGDHVVALGVIS